MADTPSSTLSAPSQGTNSPDTSSRLPDLSQGVRSAVPGFESAIETATEQTSGRSGDDKPAAPKTSAPPTSTSAPQQQSTESEPESHMISEDELRGTTRKKITDLLSTLGKTADKIQHSNSPSRASNFARIIANMRQLNISLNTLYRMSLDKVRELYTQLKSK